MCFSAQADVVGGIAVAVVGIDALRHVGHRREYAALAVLPLLLALHQLDEAFVWWGLQGHVAADVGRVATWVYLIFAFVVLPVLVPVAIYALEAPGWRRRVIGAFVALGSGVSIILLAAMVRGPVTAHLADYHLSYGTGLSAGGLIVVVYVIATCGSLLFSGYRDIVIFGIVNLIGVVVLARLTIDGFASLWCGWAALASVAIALQLRLGRPHRSAPQVPAPT